MFPKDWRRIMRIANVDYETIEDTMEPKIITELRAFLLAPDKSVTWPLTATEAQAIINEYDRMRGLAGAVSDGPGFVELTKSFSRGSMPNG